jgi:hypothetical protein
MFGSVTDTRNRSAGFRCDGVLDIETARWDRFVVGVTLYRGTEVAIHRSIGSLVDELLRRRGTWWAHNGGSFDALAVAEELRARGIASSIALSGSRVSRLSAAGFTLCDSYSLIPMPLERAASLADMTAPELGLPCRCGRACGGYCALRAGRSSPTIDAYCVGDCRVLWAVLEWVQAHADRCGLSLRGTIGGTAWASARAILGLPDADLPPATWRRARLGYYGGRICVARPRADGPGTHWDISSAYPAALASSALPVGDHREIGSRVALSCLERERPGIYACEIDVPGMHLPPLPWRARGGAIAYPIGPVVGAWALPEILAAVDRGATIRRVLWGIVWESEEIIFAELIRSWHGIRIALGKSTAGGEWTRLLANSLTGKFAESPERRGISMFPTEVKYCLGEDPCSVARCSGRCGAYEQVDLAGQIWSVPYYRPAPNAHVAWAAYLTASTRGAWLAGAESQGKDLVYGDTDSVWTTSRKGPTPQGAALGAWQKKHAWQDWECAAPKSYCYRDGESSTVRASGGQSISLDDWRRGAARQDEGAVAFLSAAASGRGLFRRRSASWSRPSGGIWYGDRQLDPDEKITHPATCEQIRQKAARRAGR